MRNKVIFSFAILLTISFLTVETKACGHNPVASFTAPSSATLGQSVTYDASASYDISGGGTITSYLWDWDGDGSHEQSVTTPTVEHAFTSTGNKKVNL